MDSFDEHPDYIWHFKLSEEARQQAPDDALLEMIREQVAALLRCVILTNDGANLRVTGFRLLEDPEHEHLLGATLPVYDGPEPEPEECCDADGLP